MKDYVINELEKLFKESNDSFVTIMANDKFIGNYCTESYKDIERLFDDMCRHDLTINDICLKKIEWGDDPKEDYLTNTISLTNKIEKLKKELEDKRSALQSTTVAKQAADYEYYQFVQKKEALEDFVDHFNGTHNDDEYMKLTKVNRTKVVLWYVTRHATRLKRFISFYDDLNLDGIRNDIALYHQLPDQLKERFFIKDDGLEMSELFYIITIKPHYKADSTPDFSHFDIIFQLDKNDDPITTTVTKENLFDVISKYIRN
jgi:hypothetical protein